MRRLEKPPIFIGGTNGSGTRVFAQALELAGVFQGREKNFAFEPKNIIQYTKPLIPQLLKITKSPTYDANLLPQEFLIMMETWIASFGAEIQAERPECFSRWGWKHPRNLFLVPLLNRVFPDCYFIHVLRDGRDMAFAEKIGDARLFQNDFLEHNVTDPSFVEFTSFWSAVNSNVADWSETHLGHRYIWSRLEDLCADPHKEFQRLTKALGIELDRSSLQKCADLVHTPKSLGRWREKTGDMQLKLREAGSAGLLRFGYVTE